ncbi:hypothetical protein COCVIDRAFT_20478 [Bipolaris victoriae FI3]|uniref:ATP-dependent RNA helicase n=1 Tax=Bipolaris victoriae (strain FI3) TaxID=930091 RepID=W7DZT3_BIPV3|nr:hypothetical protein COCVIDRAFT_20478 [Bipolaris victoriae FI3]
MAGPLFKRFAPPAPAPKKQSSPTPVHSETSNPAHTTNEPVVAFVTTPVEGDVVPRSIKKPKRRKRETEEANDESDEVAKKHKSILSKFEKSSKLAEAKSQQHEDEVTDKEEEEEELHDLEPMPQPAPVPEPAYEPTFSTLPTWLAQPTTIEASKTVPFSELGVGATYVKKLEKQGFKDALAVQTALLPMLHPGFDQHLGDICVSAKTGSGKTLAYLLPIIEALKDRAVPILSAIIVVPSRQLVNQALQVAEELCTGTKIKLGTALGNVAFATEKKQLVKMRAQYDPKRAQELNEKASQQHQMGLMERGGLYEDLKNMPLGHVPKYDSGVDILICTPGRLVEHIEHTTGFLLNNLRWLVIDEADQLLNQNFQGWASVLMDAIHGETPYEFTNARERMAKQLRDANSAWSVALPQRQVTKIVLSATMEKDVSKLGTLKLKRPKLVVVQDASMELQPMETEDNVFELPSRLEEFAVHQTGRVLIFTKSTESASRLSHLLSALMPGFKNHLKTMTRALTADASRKLLKSFSSGAIKILIASDAASRGLDIPDITHVINYDLPTSITSYVHRVGRTARAGKAGQAWTLFSKTEAAWFLKQIAKGDSIKRGNNKVRRMEWKESAVTADGKKQTYRAALKQLESAVSGQTGSG